MRRNRHEVFFDFAPTMLVDGPRTEWGVRRQIRGHTTITQFGRRLRRRIVRIVKR